MAADDQIWPPDDGRQLLKRRNVLTVLITQNNYSHMPSLALWSFNFWVDVIRYRSRPHVSGIVWIRNFFFSDSKISTSTRIHMQIEFARPHESDTYRHVSDQRILIHSSTQDSSGNIGNRACVAKRAKFVSCSAFHGEELGLILLRHRIKKYQDLVTTRSRINSVFKKYISTLESGFKKLRIRMPDSPYTSP